MRKTMRKEVTSTTIKFGKVSMVDGAPQLEQLSEEKLVGNVSLERAGKLMKEKHGNVTIFEVVPETQTYELPVEKFLEIATPVEQDKQESLDV